MAILTRSKSACTKSLQYGTGCVVCRLMIITREQEGYHAGVYLLATEDVFLLSISRYGPSGEIVDLMRSITNLDAILLSNALLEKIYLKLYEVIII